MKAPFKAFRLLYHLSQCSKYFLRYRVSRTLCVLGVWEPLPWGGVIWCNLDTVSQRQTPRTPSPHDTLSADVLFVDVPIARSMPPKTPTSLGRRPRLQYLRTLAHIIQ